MTTQPTTFQELTDLVNSGQLPDTRRTYGSEQLYQAYLQYVPEETKELILTTQRSQSSSRINIYESSITPNSFPYDLLLKNLPKIKHMLLWYKEWDIPTVDIQEMARIWIKALYRQDLEFCHLVNNPENRSIKNKPHAHIFINFENFI